MRRINTVSDFLIYNMGFSAPTGKVLKLLIIIDDNACVGKCLYWNYSSSNMHLTIKLDIETVITGIFKHREVVFNCSVCKDNISGLYIYRIDSDDDVNKIDEDSIIGLKL